MEIIKNNQRIALFIFTAMIACLVSCNPLGKSSTDNPGILCIGASNNPDCEQINQSADNANLSIEQAATQQDPTNNSNIIFTALFSETMDPSTFNVEDIIQLGSAEVSWTITDTNAAKEFTLTATAESPGTVIPIVNRGAVKTASGGINELSTSIDNNVTYDIDITPPSNLVHLATQLTSNDTAPTSWTLSSDMDIVTYQLAIGTTGVGLGQTDLIDWTDVGTDNNHPGFMNIIEIFQCTAYFTSLRAIDAAGNISSSITTANSFSIDSEAPMPVSMLAVSNTFATTDQTHEVSWTASTDNCDFDQYEFALGTSGMGSGQNDLIDWTEIGNILSFSASSPTDAIFTLNHGTNYFTSIRAKDSVGNISNVSTTAAWQLNYDYAKFSATQTVSGININQNPSRALLWTADVVDTAVFGHSHNVNSQNITLLSAGNYLAQLTLPMIASVTRSNVRVDFYLDGVLLQGGRSESSYIRNDSGHNESSDHVHFVIPAVGENQILTVEVQQIAGSGTVNITNQANLVLTKLQSDHKALSALATTTLAGSNFNLSTPQAMLWDRESSDLFDPSVFSHNSGNSTITINESGDYLVYLNVPFNDPNGNRNDRISVRGEIKVNGVTMGYARQGYLRRGNGHNEASIHWAGILRNINVSDIITVELARDTTVTQALNISVGQSASLFIQKMTTSEYIDLSGTTVNNGSAGESNLNQVGQIEWSVLNSINAAVFTHDESSDSENIIIDQAGDYYFAFNTTLTSTVQRANIAFRATVNGVTQPGLECKSNYIRSLNNHNHSSCSMVSLLHDLKAGDIIRISTQNEAAAGTVTASFPANLLIWKRP